MLLCRERFQTRTGKGNKLHKNSTHSTQLRSLGRKKKASVSIEPEIWQRMRKIHADKLGRKLGARSPTNLVEKVLIAFIAKHDGNYDKYLKALDEITKELLQLDDHAVKGATLGDLDGSG